MSNDLSFINFPTKNEFSLRLYWEILKRISVLYSSFYLLRLSSLSVNSIVKWRLMDKVIPISTSCTQPLEEKMPIWLNGEMSQGIIHNWS